MSGGVSDQLKSYLNESSTQRNTYPSVQLQNVGKDLFQKISTSLHIGQQQAGHDENRVPLVADEGVGDAASSGANSWFPFIRPSTVESPAEPSWFPALSWRQRVVGFAGCFVLGIVCFTLAMLYLPFLVLQARKFVLIYSLGSIFFICSFGFYFGPWNHLRSLFSAERAGFSAAYFGTLFATLYFALSLQSTPLTVVAAVLQMIALLWFLVSHIPGGQKGLTFISSIFCSVCKKTAQTTGACLV